VSKSTPTPPTLTRRELNRALLARQLLLERAPITVLEVIEHLVGMQAQSPNTPYVGLWSRIAGFDIDDLSSLYRSRDVVRIAAMRSTIHLVSSHDCIALRNAVQPVVERLFKGGYAKLLKGIDLDEMAAVGREAVESSPMTFSQIGQHLASRWPGHNPNALAYATRALVPLVQVPPRGIWGEGGLPLHTSAESWITKECPSRIPVEDLIRRYLAAFGPASVRDFQAWSGLTRMRDTLDGMSSTLVRFQSEDGVDLFDLPNAPRPRGDLEVPVRFLPEFDNALLSHHDRSRIIADEFKKLVYVINGVIPGTVLVDGFVRGKWHIEREKKKATLRIERFDRWTVDEKSAVSDEGKLLLGFAARESNSRSVRFSSVTPGS
jgi:hypothetical protein